MIKVKIVESYHFNGCNTDMKRYTFIDGKRVKNNDYYRFDTNNFTYDHSETHNEYTSPTKYKEVTEIYYKVIDK